MLKQANTGDLLLFSGKRMACTLQRLVTRSRFGNFENNIDHVAMLLKYQDGRIFLFEATSNKGVEITKWDDQAAAECGLMYERIVYRKANFKRTNKCICDLEVFLKVICDLSHRMLEEGNIA